MTAEMERLWSELTHHVPFLLLVLPVIGALLVGLARFFGEDVVSRTAWTNLLLSLIVTSWLLIRFQPGTPSDSVPRGFVFQMADMAPLEPEAETLPAKSQNGPAVAAESRFPLLRVAVGVDGWNLWPLLLIPLLYLPALGGLMSRSLSAGRFSLLLLSQGAAVAVFTATDLVQWVIALELLVLFLFFSAGDKGTAETRRKMVSFAVLQLGGSLLLLLGLTMAVTAHRWSAGEKSRPAPAEKAGTTAGMTFSLERLSRVGARHDEETEAVRRLRLVWEPVIFAALLLGLLIKAGIFPAHGWFAVNGKSWHAPEVWVGILLLRCAGVYGYLRLMAGLCPQMAESAASGLRMLLLFGGVFCGLVAITRGNGFARLRWASAAHLTLVLAAVVCWQAAAVQAAVFLLFTHLAGFGILGLCDDFYIASSEETTSWEKKEPSEKKDSALQKKGGAGGMTAGRILPSLAILALAGCPGLSGFPALWLLLQANAAGNAGSVMTGVLTLSIVLLTAWALLSTLPLFGRFPSPSVERAAGGNSSENEAEKENKHAVAPALLLPLLLVLIGAGLAPQFVVNRTRETIRRLPAGETSTPGRGAAEDESTAENNSATSHATANSAASCGVPPDHAAVNSRGEEGVP